MPNATPYSTWTAEAIITAAAQAATVAKTVRSANHQLFVKNITLSITTHANAKVALTVQSSNATPVVIFSRTDLTAAAGVPDVIEVEFPGDGLSVVKGENVDWLWSTAGSGPVGRAVMSGYEKLIGPVAPATTN